MIGSSAPAESAISCHEVNTPTLWNAAYVMAFLTAAVIVAAIDRQIPALLVAPLKSAFAVNDTVMGSYQGAALWVPALCTAFPLGILVDRGKRVRLTFYVLLTLGISTLLSAFCMQFWQLFLCRMCLGAAFGGLMPCVYSLIADLYDSRRRQTAFVVILAAITLGNGAAFSVGGAIVQFVTAYRAVLNSGLSSLEPWRVTLIAVALPTLVLAALLVTLNEPVRQRAKPSRVGAQSGNIRQFLCANLLTIALLFGGLVGAENAIDMTLVWTAAILGRQYGWTISQSGEWLGLVVGLSSLAGLALAAWLVRLLKQRFGEIAPLQVARFALFALTVLFIALFFVRNGRLFLSAIGLIITVIYLVIAVTPELLVGFAPTELRGRFLALYFVVAMFGAIISPIVVGALSDRLHVGRAGLGDSYTGAGIINAGVAAALFALCVPRLRAVVVTPEETRNRERGG